MDHGAVVLVDALGAPQLGGGMNLYARETVQAWAERHPEDRLLVVGAGWTRAAWTSRANVKAIVWPDSPTPLRFLGQLLVVPVLAALRRADAIFSVSPIVSPLALARRTACVVHDWRHVRRPSEFSWAQRTYRKLWNLSIKRSRSVFVISEKTAEETRQIAPGVTPVVVPNGRDHPRHWAIESNRPASAMVVTYAQHTNKRPGLVVQGFAIALRESGADLVLHVLGARGEAAAELERAVESAEVREAVVLRPHVEEREYRALVQQASAVVLASSDEGFGLPIVEAEFFGVPAVLTADSGVADLHPSALIAEPSAASIAEQLGRALRSPGPSRAGRSSAGASWFDVADRVRASLIPGRGRGPGPGPEERDDVREVAVVG